MRKSILFIAILICACTESKELKSTPSGQPGNYNEYLSTLKLPDELSFCGEKVPLDVPEVRERAEREFYMLLQAPGQVILYLKRAGRYFPVFDKIIKEEGMPEDIKYISVAESALYMARSAKNAVGLWQFIPSTGKLMGLQIDDYVDERRHPEKSTRAAMKYLRQGYKSQGSWTMAAAGYNMGHENLSGSKNFQAAKEFFEMYLNEETSRYILRIIIIKEIMSNPAKYGFKLSEQDIYKPETTKTVKCTTAISNISDWAKQQGTTYKDVKILNPWILERKLPAPRNGSYEIAIPSK